jgi:hypothetical protein
MLRFLAVLLLVTGVGHACDCGPRPACGGNRSDSRYFVGVPISVKIVKGDPGEFGPIAIYRIRVTEPLSSNLPPTDIVEVRTGTGGADCSWHFQLNETYFIEAYSSLNGHLSTSLCRWTGLLADSEMYVRPLRDIRDHRRPASLLVYVSEMKVFGWKTDPIPQVAVTARSSSGAFFRAASDERGIATFGALPPGNYDLSPALPGSIILDTGWAASPTHVEIPHEVQLTPAFCRGYLDTEPSGSIEGRVIARRALLRYAMVTVSSLRGGSSTEIAVDSKDGTFSTRHFEAGTYRITFTSERQTLSAYTQTVEVRDANRMVVTLRPSTHGP